MATGPLSRTSAERGPLGEAWQWNQVDGCRLAHSAVARARAMACVMLLKLLKLLILLILL